MEPIKTTDVTGIRDRVFAAARASRRREIEQEIVRVLARAAELEARGVAKARIVVQEHAALTGDRDAAARAGGQVLDATQKLLDVMAGQVAHLRRRLAAHTELEVAVPPSPVLARLAQVLDGADQAIAALEAHSPPVPGGWVPSRPKELLR